MEDKSRIPTRTRLLRSLLRASVQESAAEDFEEHYQFLAGSRGRFRAMLWFWIQIFCLIPVFFKDTFLWSFVMLRNFLKIALRVIMRQKGYSVINITGLAIGIACSILFMLWIQDELGYDGFHENRDRLFRIVSKADSEGVSEYYAVTPLPLGPTLKQEYPGVVRATRFNAIGLRLLLGSETQDEKGTLVDPDFLQMFSFELLAGDPETCLGDPLSIVITESLATKYFAAQNPVGQVLTTQAGTDFRVSGVMQDVPHNSHLQFDFLIPFELLARLGRDLNNWDDVSYFTYVMLDTETNASNVNQMIEAILDKYRERRDSSRYLQPLKGIHLRSHFKFDMEGHGDIRYVYIFSLAAALILMLACINFMNLATARSGGRAKEVGIRKVVGAYRSHVIRQFLGESMLLTLLAFLVSLVLVWLLLPVFNVLSGKPLVFDLTLDPALYVGLLGIVLFTGLLSGSYPAFFLSGFQPVKVLRGRLRTGGRGVLFRRILVVTQFSLSILLVIGTLVIYRQIHYMKNANLGFATDHLIHIPMSREVYENYDAVKIEILRSPGILNVTAVDLLPIYEGSGTSNAEWEGKPADFSLQMRIGAVDFDFLETFELQMTQGRFFSQEVITDSSEGFVLNEAAVKAMGLKDPIGKRFGWKDRQGRIIGIIQDYQLRTLHYEVEPLALFVDPDWFAFLCVKLDATNVTQSLALIKKAWGKYSPGNPFQFRFFDNDIETLYRSEERIGSLFKYFTLLALFISSLGLFGLASYLAEQRTKEIGIRKILGASVPKICLLLSQEFFKWVAAANLIAWPAAYFLTGFWLRSFAHRTGFTPWTFLLSGVLSITVAAAAIGYQSIRAAFSNPVVSLRHE